MTTAMRARKGGEVAPNGEFYKGGQFINTVPENAKRKKHCRRNSQRQVPVSPTEWGTPPSPGSLSIFKRLNGIYGVVADGQMKLNASPQTLAFYGDCESEIVALAEKYNRGERWFTPAA